MVRMMNREQMIAEIIKDERLCVDKEKRFEKLDKAVDAFLEWMVKFETEQGPLSVAAPGISRHLSRLYKYSREYNDPLNIAYWPNATVFEEGEEWMQREDNDDLVIIAR